MVNVADYSHANLGKVEIVPEVISVIASIAVSEVEGVTGHFYELRTVSYTHLTLPTIYSV